ncbi:hypothetical protein MHT86_01230 [Corynebacterium mastitidis]|uniref:FCS-type domain-containing protein n=1 Tax=Corynebacterium mastitidis TaxID=161890 RepID=A0A2N0XAI5_9CORY|nr:hypothetical protein [Corynebacterium mastitidis]MCH6196124.1 hypothetical protein [Corynebacterium mastitidis]MDK8449939.1 hypothetical protein [Corynebacterium mastitidis]PKF69733.1 hypothetical protein CXB45_00800 [Corynebacterium mastitidis]
MSHVTYKKQQRCAWCGKEMEPSTRGRPKKYCCPSCKQRAYEQRHNITGTRIPQDAVIMTQERAERLQDSLFELRCSAEDIATAAREGAGGEELQELCTELVELARSIEKLR